MYLLDLHAEHLQSTTIHFRCSWSLEDSIGVDQCRRQEEKRNRQAGIFSKVTKFLMPDYSDTEEEEEEEAHNKEDNVTEKKDEKEADYHDPDGESD